MSVSTVFADLRLWTTRRWMISVGVAAAAYVGLAIASGTIASVGGSLTFPGPLWAYALMAVGAGLAGMVVASYFAAPIGAEATMCDLRWPVLGLVAIVLSTDLRTAVPMLTGAVRPVVALAAIALLAWALLERLGAEHRAVADAGDGEVCTTCRPLFPQAHSRS